jgi:hypothetical protein
MISMTSSIADDVAPRNRVPVKTRVLVTLVSTVLGCIPVYGQDASLDVCEQYVNLLLVPERALIGTIRQLQQLSMPLIGPRNMRARWIQRDVHLNGESFNTAFYLQSGLVQRIELVSNAPDTQCRSKKPWAAAIATLEAWRGQLGVSGNFSGGATEQTSAHWLTNDVDVSAFLSFNAESCTTKIVFKKRDLKDASTL